MKSSVPISCSTYAPPLWSSRRFAARRALPGSFPSLYSSREIVGKDHGSLCCVRVQTRSPKRIHLAVFFLNGNGAYGTNHEDGRYAVEASQVKLLVWGFLQRWGPSVVVGAMAGSIVAQKTRVLIVSFSFIVLMAAQKAMKSQLWHFHRVSDIFSRHALNRLITIIKLFVSRVILYLAGALMACVKGSRTYARNLLVPMRSFLERKQINSRVLLSLKQEQARENAKESTLGSDSQSSDTLISDINTCIQNVEGVLSTEKGMPTDAKWFELKDSLSLLKAKVEILSNDVSVSLDPGIKVSVKKDKSSTGMKAKEQQSELEKMNAFRTNNFSVNKSANTLKQDSMHQTSGKLHVINAVGDDISLTSNDASIKSASIAAVEGATLDQESGLPSKEVNSLGVSDSQFPDSAAAVNAGEYESLSRPQNRYIDYWIEEDQNGSVMLSDFERQMSKDLNKDNHFHRKDSVTQVSQDFWRESDSKSLSSDSGRKDVYLDEHASSINFEVGSVISGNVNFATIRINDDHCSKKLVGNVNNETSLIDPGTANDDSKEEKRTDVNVKAILSGSLEDSTLNTNVKKRSVVEQGAISLGSTKELAFVREGADLHVLTGFSQRVNDREFQKSMTDGETALKYGKAGLFGDMEIGDAERMLYKAADCFASAAALDPSSVEAVGFWGNSLLVHGELKLMLSRELRHMISTPDIISPYWIRHKKGSEASEGSNRVVLQRTFRAVCEECEELLLQAGRRYRRVLSISNSEVRALYNWGLALCFRAQLIAEEGGQDSREAADKIYLAAIDKFEAIMGISRRYAPGAMLNWGLTLKDRSRLWPADSPERIDLLQQAKQLFTDALRLQPDDAQIHSVFVTCSLELKELYRRQETPSKRSMKSFFGKW